MGTITYQVPAAGSEQNFTADPKLATALQTLLTWANGNVDAANIAATLAQATGVNQAGQTVKGAVNIATSESRTSTVYGTLTTPDQVTGIVLPANGLIRVWYQASWQESVPGAARAAIFVGSNQLVVASDLANPVTEAAGTDPGVPTNTKRPLSSCPFGLISHYGSVAYLVDATAGQAVAVAPTSTSSVSYDLGGTLYAAGGNNVASLTAIAHGSVCDIFAAAGTYTVSVQFKASSGSVTASNRKLWVQALSFA